MVIRRQFSPLCISLFLSVFVVACRLPSIDDHLLQYDLYIRLLKTSSTSINQSSTETNATASQATGRNISGTVAGLFSIGLLLKNIDGKEITLSPGQTSFTISNAEKGNYNVTIQRQPLGQRCNLSNPSGNSDVTISDLSIVCAGIGEKGIGLWDTGVTVCYTDTNASSGVCSNSLFPRQDGDIAPTMARSFTIRADGNIKDNITGLIWAPCIAGLSGVNCSIGTAITSTFNGAQTKCGPLPWRVPSSKELMSIIDFTNPTYGIVSQFPSHPPGFSLWSNQDLGSQSHVLNITTGTIDILSKFNTTQGHVQCVNDSEVVSVATNFTDLGNGIIRDEVNGLEWEKCIQGLSGATCNIGTYSSQFWQNRLSYCASLSLGGHSDWRMPNINELTSLVDYSRFSLTTTLDPIFVGSPYNIYHSSTTLGNGNNHSGNWYSSVGNFPFYAGSFTANNYKNQANPTRCVRGPSL